MGYVIAICSILGAIAVGVAAVPRIYRAVIAVSQFVVNFNRAAPVLMQMADSAPVLLTIAHEFTVTGNGSLKDRIIRIERKSDEAKAVAETKATEAIELVKSTAEELQSLTEDKARALVEQGMQIIRWQEKHEAEDRKEFATGRAEFVEVKKVLAGQNVVLDKLESTICQKT